MFQELQAGPKYLKYERSKNNSMLRDISEKNYKYLEKF